MPSDEEFRELKDQVASLSSALATARRRIDDLEDGMADHLGLDWGESLVDVNSPHPNISANTIESGGGAIRQDQHGGQIDQTTAAKGWYIVDGLKEDPSTAADRGYFTGYADDGADASAAVGATSTSGGRAEVNFLTTATKRTAALTGALGLSRFENSQITANKNDWAIGSTDTIQLVSSDASRDITGIVKTAISDSDSTGTQPILILLNVGAQNIVLKDESVSSAEANRFALKADITLAPDGGAILVYDSDNSRWRCAGTY
jgi:hypothetical protein